MKDEGRLHPSHDTSPPLPIRAYALKCLVKARVDDLYLGSHRDPLKQGHYIPGTHPDATKARRSANEPLHRGSVDENSTAQCPLIAGIETAQTQDPGHDRIAPRRIRPENLPGGTPTFEYRPRREPAPDFRCYGQGAQGCGKTPWSITETKPRGRHWESCNAQAVFHEKQLLVSNTDKNTPISMGNRDEGSQEDDRENNGNSVQRGHVVLPDPTEEAARQTQAEE